MPDHHNEHDQQDQQNHDDCEDCRRQRAENDQLIAIYQKLQQVDKRASDMKGSIVLHQQQVQKNRDVLTTFDPKLQQVKVQDNHNHSTQFQQIGYNLYAETLLKAKKNHAHQQNSRLKLMLKKIYQEKTKLSQSVSVDKPQPSIQMPPILPPLSQKLPFQWSQKDTQTSRTQSKTQKSFQQTAMEKSFQIFSTKSSFNMTGRKTFEKKDFEELNLWLFQQKNEILEKQLYESPPQQQLSDSHHLGSLKNGVQKYINNARNATRLGASTVLRSSMRRESSVIKRGPRDSFDNSCLGRDGSLGNRSETKRIKEILPEESSNPGRFFTRRPLRGSVLPAISSK